MGSELKIICYLLSGLFSIYLSQFAGPALGNAALRAGGQRIFDGVQRASRHKRSKGLSTSCKRSGAPRQAERAAVKPSAERVFSREFNSTLVHWG